MYFKNNLTALSLALALLTVVPASADFLGGDQRFMNGEGGGGTGSKTNAKGRIFTGRFVQVDGTNQTIELENKNGEKLQCTLSPTTKIILNERVATLADLKVGMYGGVQLSVDGRSVQMLKAVEAERAGDNGSKRIFSGRVTAINCRERTIVLTNKLGRPGVFLVGADTLIRVNGAPGTLEEIRPEMNAGVHIVEEGKPIRELRAWDEPAAK